MKIDFAAVMSRALQATRSSNASAATRIIQDALASRGDNDTNRTDPDVLPALPPPPPAFRLVGTGAATPGAEAAPPAASPNPPGFGPATLQRMRKPLGDVLQILRQGVGRARPPGMEGRAKVPAAPPLPQGAQFPTRSFACAHGSRSYKLYIPAAWEKRGLIVMLHGCQQNPDDFATGTNMNGLAEANGLLVAYPQQRAADNASSCWYWFAPAHQGRDGGEPAIIAGLTREIIAEFALDPAKVFVAGLSAGGAMALVMAQTCPDLFAAAGVHSGLAYKSANDVVSAFAAMRGDAGLGAAARPAPASRMIVFHGSADRTVHPANARRIMAATAGQSRHVQEPARNGRSASRTFVTGTDGTVAAECWLIEGAGHAWSGGHPGGSYTDPLGPDASAEMVRFFLDAASPK